ncbi:MAG: hypothetical protein JWR50_1136 [Mucilaginibacter sp.]|nr:hypothetical protein [Mucilaginibacter sp.]
MKDKLVKIVEYLDMSKAAALVNNKSILIYCYIRRLTMTAYNTLTDNELVGLLKAEDEEAYTEIYDRYRGSLLIHAYKKLGDFEEAKDVVQEMFSSLWNDRLKIPETKNLVGYLYTIVRNKILNYIEHKKVEHKYASVVVD